MFLQQSQRAGTLIGMSQSLYSRACGNSGCDRNKLVTWLAAMLECEGTFTFQYNEQVKNGILHSHIQPRLIFVNSDFAMVDAVVEAMRSLGFVAYERLVTSTTGLGKKPKRELQYSGFKSLPLLKMLLPEMVGAKREVVECMIAFIEYRMKLKMPKRKYGDYEFSLLRQVREINSGQWNNKPKFSEISEDAVGERRTAAKAVIQ